jgi:hypothetical protein
MIKENEYQLNTPVALLLFNRPSTTAKVLEAVRKAKPPKLLVVTDGPRKDRPNDLEQCAAVLNLIHQVDWDCQVLKNYSDINLGSYQRNSSGLNWIFSMVEEAIILEDDCIPHPSFFRFCEELLNYYRNDERVMVISGDNFLLGRYKTPYSYHFSKYPHTWGWASWRRSWEAVDLEMKFWPEFRKNRGLEAIFSNHQTVEFWDYIFQSIYTGKMRSAWDYKLILTSFMRNCVSVVPSVNLVSNIGHGLGATHTKDANDPFADIPTQEIQFPLQHPAYIAHNLKADEFTQKYFFRLPTLSSRLKRRFDAAIGKVFYLKQL